MLLAAEGVVKVIHIPDKHTEQYGGQNEPQAFNFFSDDILRQNQICLRLVGVASVSSFLTVIILNRYM